MSSEAVHRVERACQDILAAGHPITVEQVATHAGLSRATLYRRPELRAIIDEHRHATRDPLTLTRLAVQIDQLRATVEALADKVRRHEEHLRRLNRPQPGATK